MGFQADRDIWSLLPRNSICKIHKSPPSTHPSTKIIHSGVWLHLDLLYSIRGFITSTSPSEPEGRQKGKRDWRHESTIQEFRRSKMSDSTNSFNTNDTQSKFSLGILFSKAGFFQMLLDLASDIPSCGKSMISILWLLFPIASRSTSEGSQFRKILPVKVSQRGGKWKGLNYLNVSYTQRLSGLNNFDVVSTQYFN